jgi:hypothetical protein
LGSVLLDGLAGAIIVMGLILLAVLIGRRKSSKLK